MALSIHVVQSSPGFWFLFFITYFILLLFSFFKRFYLFIHERHTERGRNIEGEAGSMQGALSGTPSQVSRITPWAEGGAKLLNPKYLDLSQTKTVGLLGLTSRKKQGWPRIIEIPIENREEKYLGWDGDMEAWPLYGIRVGLEVTQWLLHWITIHWLNKYPCVHSQRDK